MGVVLQFVAYWLFPHSPIIAILSALAIVIAISYGFELFSLFSGFGHYDFYDAIASIIGSMLGMAIVIWAQNQFGILNMVIEAQSVIPNPFKLCPEGKFGIGARCGICGESIFSPTVFSSFQVVENTIDTLISIPSFGSQ